MQILFHDQKKPEGFFRIPPDVVEHRGFEPLTSTMRTLRATNCANAPYEICTGNDTETDEPYYKAF